MLKMLPLALLLSACATAAPVTPPPALCPTVTPIDRTTQAAVADGLDHLEREAPALHAPMTFAVTDWIRMRDDARDCEEVLSR